MIQNQIKLIKNKLKLKNQIIKFKVFKCKLQQKQNAYVQTFYNKIKNQIISL